MSVTKRQIKKIISEVTSGHQTRSSFQTDYEGLLSEIEESVSNFFDSQPPEKWETYEFSNFIREQLPRKVSNIIHKLCNERGK